MPTPRRKWTALASAAVLCFAGAGVNAAQDAPGAAPKDAPQEQQAAGKLTATYDSLFIEYQGAQRNFSAAYQAAKDDAERRKILEEKYPQPDKFAPRFAEFAEKNPNDPKAIDALAWIITNARQGLYFKQALRQLEDHIQSEKIAPVVQSLVYSGEPEMAARFLQKVAEENPHREVKGAAVYALADHRMNRGRQAEAEKGFEEVVEKYGDIKHYRGTLADAAKAQLHEIRNLAVGKPAPEIEGEDVDGKKFKLSEYRGKVVVLDFWGDW